MAGEPIKGKLQNDLARACRPGTFTLDLLEAFQKATNVDQQACEFRTNIVQRMMHALSRSNYCFGQQVCPFATVTAATGR
jgi:hypothetical protein